MTGASLSCAVAEGSWAASCSRFTSTWCLCNTCSRTRPYISKEISLFPVDPINKPRVKPDATTLRVFAAAAQQVTRREGWDCSDGRVRAGSELHAFAEPKTAARLEE